MLAHILYKGPSVSAYVTVPLFAKRVTLGWVGSSSMIGTREIDHKTSTLLKNGATSSFQFRLEIQKKGVFAGCGRDIILLSKETECHFI